MLLFSTAGDNRTFLYAFLNVDCLHVYMPTYIASTCLHTLRLMAQRMNRLSNRYKRVNYGPRIASLEWSVAGVQIAVDSVELNFQSSHHRLHSTIHIVLSRGEILFGCTRQHLFWLSCFCDSNEGLKVISVHQRSWWWRHCCPADIHAVCFIIVEITIGLFETVRDKAKVKRVK